MHTFIFVLQAIAAVALIVLMAIQTDKAEQGGGGVMGLGAAGGRTSGQIDMAVGAERILKPLTKWIVVAFLFLCVLNALGDAVTIWHFLGAIVVYVVVMLFGGTVWTVVTGTRR